MSLKPTDDRVLVEIDEPETVSKGGVILAQQAQTKPTEGTVVAKGAQVPDDVNVGDKIVFSKYGGYLTEVAGEEKLFLRYSDVLAVKS